MQKTIRAIVVDDELRSREVLVKLIETFCEGIEVCGTADDVNTAVRALDELKPDIAFLDISLRTGDSFESLKQTRHLDFLPVFVTAYNENTSGLLNYLRIPVLLKPVDIALLEEEISTARQKIYDGNLTATKALLSYLKDSSQIPVLLTSGEMLLTDPAGIIAATAQSYGSRFWLKDGRNLQTIHPIEGLQSLLPAQSYYSENGRFVAEKSAFHETLTGKKLVRLPDGNTLPLDH